MQFSQLAIISFLGASTISLATKPPNNPTNPNDNLGFELNDFSGWTISGETGSTFVGGSFDIDGAPLDAPLGNFCAKISAGCPENTLSFSFQAKAGDILVGYGAWDGEDSTSWNDQATIEIIQESGPTRVYYADILNNGPGSDWLKYEFVIPKNGPYTIVGTSANFGDCLVDSHMFMDQCLGPAVDAGGPYVIDLAAGLSVELNGVVGDLSATFEWTTDCEGGKVANKKSKPAYRLYVPHESPDQECTVTLTANGCTSSTAKVTVLSPPSVDWDLLDECHAWCELYYDGTSTTCHPFCINHADSLACEDDCYIDSVEELDMCKEACEGCPFCWDRVLCNANCQNINKPDQWACFTDCDNTYTTSTDRNICKDVCRANYKTAYDECCATNCAHLSGNRE